MKTSLYAYFGLLDLHTIDSPGHSLYQLGLIDSIRVSYDEETFDFYSYYPEQVIHDYSISPNTSGYMYPEGELGKVFQSYYNEMISNYCLSFDNVITNIKNNSYHKLYLKARFRNLSTLAKKWKDARDFEKIIETAISSGYSKDRIIVLDTDLSLPESFYLKYSECLTTLIPSIDFPGISDRFLNSCVSVHSNNYNRKSNIVFYGNIDTSNYKNGNSKSENLMIFLNDIGNFYQNADSKFSIISKKLNGDLPYSHEFIKRNDRLGIWKTLENSSIMINITKEKYDSQKFIPARIYEAMIFGLTPISYKFNFLDPAFSFECQDDLIEIIKYFNECDSTDLKNAYLHFIKSYTEYKLTNY
jgi:hypothetical protein